MGEESEIAETSFFFHPFSSFFLFIFIFILFCSFQKTDTHVQKLMRAKAEFSFHYLFVEGPEKRNG